MKRLLLAATMALITTSDIAIAAQQAAPAQRPGRPDRPPQVRPTPHPPQVRPPVQRPRPPVTRPTPRPPQVRPPVQRPRPPVARPPQVRPPVRPPHRPGAGRPPNFRPIHGPAYRYPHGYRYRRWTVGLLLPSIFLSNLYYYNSYADLGVGPPPPGYRWVRYGPDLLLIQIRTRRVVDVIYGAFY